MIHKHVKTHVGHYLPLLAIFVAVILFITQVQNKQTQAAIAVAAAFFYVVWGIFHHMISHDLTVKIVIEYILIGSLGMSILLFIVQGGLV